MKQTARVVSVHSGAAGSTEKQAVTAIMADLEGFAGDRHRGFTRVAQSWDREPAGTVRRNERQWSGVSAEELALISEKMDLVEPLQATSLGANLCIEGIDGFSKLPMGTRLEFPSGAVLIVQEENDPCSVVGDVISGSYITATGKPAEGKFFPKLAMGLRGVVGFVDVPGEIKQGDEVIITTIED